VVPQLADACDSVPSKRISCMAVLAAPFCPAKMECGSIGMPLASRERMTLADDHYAACESPDCPGLAGDAFSLMARGCLSSSGVRSLSILEKTDRVYEL